MKQNSEPSENPNALKKKRNSRKLFMGIFTTLFLVIVGTSVYIYVHKSNPMIIYLSAEKKALEDKQQYFDDYRTTKNKMADKKREQPYVVNSNINGKFNFSKEDISFKKNIFKLMEKLDTVKANMAKKINPKTNNSYFGMKISSEKERLANIKLYQNGNKSGVKIPFLYNDKLVLNNNKLGEFLNKYNLKGEVKEIPKLNNIKFSSINLLELEEFMKDFAVENFSELSEDQYKLKDDVNFIGGTYDKVTLQLTPAQTKTLLQGFSERLNEDSQLWTILKEQLLNHYNNDKSKNSEKISAENVPTNPKKLRTPKGLQLNAYIDDGMLVYRDIQFQIGTQNPQELFTFTIESKYLKEGKDIYSQAIALSIKPEYTEGKLRLNYAEKGVPDNKKLSVTRDLSLQLNNGVKKSGVNLVATTEYLDNRNFTTFEFSMENQKKENTSKISGSYATKTEKDNNQVIQSFALTIDATMYDEVQNKISAQAEFQGKHETDFRSELTVPVLDESALNVFHMTEKEATQMGEEIETNFEQHVDQIEDLSSESIGFKW